ncbi:hypothetical protein TREVI0001_0047 [Treponema vincentii ATCC 35580]|uniref:Uncharacterized protein n=1 Tax=Treponema vincentii ATCC 35580 TaxID=596324 RepID=C8PRR4_9SPIR|nr:hypothetical protein TREVI0001_0047 [Treponema vincentii ATCC 35580]
MYHHTSLLLGSVSNPCTESLSGCTRTCNCSTAPWMAVVPCKSDVFCLAKTHR